LVEFQKGQWYYDIGIAQELGVLMTDWQITAKTIYCEAVDDEVTLLINKDGSSHCTGFRKYTTPNAITVNTIKVKNKRAKQHIQCEGEGCTRLTGYKNQILSEIKS
jgi:hypothetical protein